MTAERYAERQQSATCQHCRSEATDGQYCADHAERQRDYNRRCAAQRRELRRDNLRCAECGVQSVPYRCTECQQRRRPGSEYELLALRSTLP